MYEVKRIGVLSAIKIVAAMYAVIGLIIGGLYACLGLTIFASTFAAELDEFGLGGGVTMIFVAICMPFLYAFIGAIVGAIGALIYNVFAGLVGGIEFELVGPKDKASY
jgi:hypothetical protein